MPILVICPSCNSRLKAPEQLAGKFVQCPKCKTRVEVPGSGHSSWSQASTSPPPAEQPTNYPPPAVTPPSPPAVANVVFTGPVPTVKQCPFCAEQIHVDALKCKHCGETIDPALRSAEESRRLAEFHARHGQPSGPTNIVVNTSASAAAQARVVAPRRPRERPFPHAAHIILTILTCGAWLPIYILHLILASRGGATVLAFIIGVPLCLLFLGCGAMLVLGVIGAALSPLPDGALDTTASLMAGQQNSHRLVLHDNSVYRIGCKTAAFDAFMQLKDPTGKVVAQDDNSGGNLDPEITYRPQQTGTYRIVVMKSPNAARAGDGGSYHLTANVK